MVLEPDTEHVVRLAFVPVGGWPDVADGIEGGVFGGGERLEAEGVAGLDGMEFVDGFPARVGTHVIGAAEVDEVVETEGCFAEGTEGFDVFALYGEGGFAAERFFVQDRKFFFDALNGSFRRVGAHDFGIIEWVMG